MLFLLSSLSVPRPLWALATGVAAPPGAALSLGLSPGPWHSVHRRSSGLAGVPPFSPSITRPRCACSCVPMQGQVLVLRPQGSGCGLGHQLAGIVLWPPPPKHSAPPCARAAGARDWHRVLRKACWGAERRAFLVQGRSAATSALHMTTDSTCGCQAWLLRTVPWAPLDHSCGAQSSPEPSAVWGRAWTRDLLRATICSLPSHFLWGSEPRACAASRCGRRGSLARPGTLTRQPLWGQSCRLARLCHFRATVSSTLSVTGDWLVPCPRPRATGLAPCSCPGSLQLSSRPPMEKEERVCALHPSKLLSAPATEAGAQLNTCTPAACQASPRRRPQPVKANRPPPGPLCLALPTHPAWSPWLSLLEWAPAPGGPRTSRGI